jgi:hypothetical protein
VDICNNDGGTRNAAIGKLEPVISFPNLITGTSVVPVTITGWTVISNDGQTIRLEILQQLHRENVPKLY